MLIAPSSPHILLTATPYQSPTLRVRKGSCVPSTYAALENATASEAYCPGSLRNNGARQCLRRPLWSTKDSKQPQLFFPLYILESILLDFGPGFEVQRREPR